MITSINEIDAIDSNTSFQRKQNHITFLIEISAIIEVRDIEYDMLTIVIISR